MARDRDQTQNLWVKKKDNFLIGQMPVIIS